MGEEEDEASQEKQSELDLADPKSKNDKVDASPRIGATQRRKSAKHNTSINDGTGKEKGGVFKVPVNEDFLFDVDIEERELAPTYWLGPIYDVRRGSWFYQEGSLLRPCDENLAIQLEEGYLKVKPWRNDSQQMTPPKPKTESAVSGGSLKPAVPAKEEPSITTKFELQTQRLFGNYMNSVVTYQDATVAWLLTDDFLSRMSSTVYQRFAGGGHLGGVKVVRGFSETSKAKDNKETKTDQDQTPRPSKLEKSADNPKRRSAPPTIDSPKPEEGSQNTPDPLLSQEEPRLLKLERQLSSFADDPEKQEEERRQADENEIKQDYKDDDGQDQGREIEHLILVTHGIGQVSEHAVYQKALADRVCEQRLGLRVESINFIHDVNVLRKTLKGVYEDSPDLQALNSEFGKLPKNCRVQVLPVVWRHLLDFPKQSFKQNRREQDLTDADAFEDDEEYPSLANITVEGVPAIRNLIMDLALGTRWFASFSPIL